MTKFDVSERLACRVLGQHRSTQRKAPKGRADDAALTADIVALATEYGRYGHRRITAMLHAAGWAVNVKRVERIWRLEGLKVPGKQPKKGRLWLSDGSCVRLRPEHPNHVWSYDFVEDRTHDGRKFRMLNVIDEFTRECLTIRIDRKLKSTDVIDVLSDLFSPPGLSPFGMIHWIIPSSATTTAKACAACRAMSVRTTVPNSSPRPCGNGSRPSGRRPPSSSPAALGRADTARASTPSYATSCLTARSSIPWPRCRASTSLSGTVSQVGRIWPLRRLDQAVKSSSMLSAAPLAC